MRSNRFAQFWQDLFGGRIRALSEFKKAANKHKQEVIGADTSADRFLNILPDVGWAQSLERLKVGLPYFTENHVLKQNVKADWQNVDHDIKMFSVNLVRVLRRKGIPVYVHGAWRTKEKQAELNRKGFSKTLWPKAAHCLGQATDIVHSRYHWELTKTEWAVIGKIGKELAVKMGLEIDWGGDWRRSDPAHWQKSNWKQFANNPPKGGTPIHKTPTRILRENGY